MQTPILTPAEPQQHNPVHILAFFLFALTWRHYRQARCLGSPRLRRARPPSMPLHSCPATPSRCPPTSANSLIGLLRRPIRWRLIARPAASVAGSTQLRDSRSSGRSPAAKRVRDASGALLRGPRAVSDQRTIGVEGRRGAFAQSERSAALAQVVHGKFSRNSVSQGLRTRRTRKNARRRLRRSPGVRSKGPPEAHRSLAASARPISLTAAHVQVRMQRLGVCHEFLQRVSPCPTCTNDHQTLPGHFPPRQAS